MILKTDNFNDLGKCSMGTCMYEFDTEKDHVYLEIASPKAINDFNDSFVEVKIDSMKDLCKFLWCIPMISTGSGTGHGYWFSHVSPWWHRDDDLLDQRDKEVAELKAKMEKVADEKKRQRLQAKVDCLDTAQMRAHLSDLDSRMEELTKELCKKPSQDAPEAP